MGRIFKGTGDANAIARLKTLASRPCGEYTYERITAALKAIGGTAQRKAARNKPAEATPSDWNNAKALPDQNRVTQIHDRLVAIGLIAPLSAEQMVAVQATEKWEDDHPAWSLLILAYAQIRTSFDVESYESPPPYNHLIWEFADNSRGMFSPQSVLQTDGKGRRPETMVQFILGHRLYRFSVRDLCDCYDSERVVAAMNYALADNGIRERFLAMDMNEQLVDFIFGDPRLIAEAAKEFQWAIDKKFNRLTNA